jgi:hypothetical protein
MEKKMNKWSAWYDSLTPSTREYLKGRAIWTDRDLAKFAMLAFIAGVIVGMVA